MEIQFSVPLQRPINGNSRSNSSSAAATSAAMGSAPVRDAQGATHRFALDTRTRHTRRSSTRARTGCSTCKKRHVKCDETRPSCHNCLKWRGYCDAYSEPSTSPTTPTSSSTSSSSSSSSSLFAPSNTKSEAKPKKRDNSKLIHTKKAPLVLSEPSFNTVFFASAQQHAYFDEWSNLSVNFLSGGVNHSRLWTATMPQLTLQEPTLRYAAMAVGALRKAQTYYATEALVRENRHYMNAISYYCQALSLQSKAKVGRETLKTALLSSLLFTCFEAQRGDMPGALKHVVHGFNLLNELAADTEKAPGLVSIAPAPPSLVEEILDCYKPLELQSRSFMGSYNKFFFPKGAPPPQPQQPPSTQGASASHETSPKATPWSPGTGGGGGGAGSASVSSPASQPGSPWSGNPASQQEPTGLPSPQSSASPQSQAESMTPKQVPSGGSPAGGPPPGAPPRPPHIQPFTKHSPYFRPRQSNICNLEAMPSMFRTFDEAHGYWSLVQKDLIQNIPLLTVATRQLRLHTVEDDEVFKMKVNSVRQNPKIAKFIDESRYWLQRWIRAFDPMWRSVLEHKASHPKPYLHAAILRIEYLIIYIYTTVPRFSDFSAVISLTSQYREINQLCESLTASRPNCGFAMDSGWTWPLFVSAFGCRDPEVRDDAIRILGAYPIRNALRDSRIFRAIAIKNREVEMQNAMEGTLDEQWQRLRRRELVFEDFGASIIYRASRKNVSTGRWELVEEAAEFKVNGEGGLDWKRQPISDSASILSGVC